MDGDSIYRIRPGGSGRRRLYSAPGCCNADWAPDGRSLAVVSKGGVLRLSRSGRQLGPIVRGPRIFSAAFRLTGAEWSTSRPNLM